MQTPLRVMIVDEKAERAEQLEAALANAGCEVVARLTLENDLHDEVNQAQPDVVIVDMECPDRDVLENMSQISRDQPRPIVMFVDRSDSESIQAAVQAGVSAYVVGGLQAERVKHVVEVAIARFKEFHTLRRELESARSNLVDRKVIERAKGILMKHRGMAEEEAFRALRKMAMDRKIRLAAVAREVVAAAELLL